MIKELLTLIVECKKFTSLIQIQNERIVTSSHHEMSHNNNKNNNNTDEHRDKGEGDSISLTSQSYHFKAQ